MTSDRTYTPNEMADAVQRMIDDGTYMPHDVLPKLVAYLRSPAPGAVAMREAAIAALTPILDSYAGFHDETGDREALVVQECIGIIRALSAPEVPEAVKEWCGHFRACVANSDEEDIWPEADFNLLAYFEKEYPDA